MANLALQTLGRWNRLIRQLTATGPAGETIHTEIMGIEGGNTDAVKVSGAVTVSETWTPSLQAEETADDSDKTFTVPASTEWMVQSVWVELTTTADVGDRQLEVQFQDSGSDVIGAIQASLVQAASLTYNYLFSLGGAELYALRDGTYLQTALPAIILPAGFKIRVWDNNAVAAAADDMVVQMMVLARTV